MSSVLHTPNLILPVGERDHVRGPATAPLTLLEYGDFECPYCGAAYPIVKEVERLFEGDLCFAFRHFPLAQIHRHAYQAAEAAEAAGGQGRFWELHDFLFEHQDGLDTQDLLGYADALGLDLARFARDLETHEHEPRLREDFLSGVRSGVNGTPTFFINGVRHNGGYDLNSLVAALREAL
jgi:protein-disulfide isomerase